MSDDPEEDRRAELLREFEAVIAGAGLDDLRELTSGLMAIGRPQPARPSMPELRRPPLDGLFLFRLRVDLRHARPPIWRRLEVRSDLRLDALHQVLQAAFNWDDYHLWRFSLGGDPFDHGSQLFLCPYDDEEGELEDEGGVTAGLVRLDECVQEPGDVLGYVYDYGDHWQLTLLLEAVSEASPEAPSAVCVDGRRAAPPEDCGSLRDAEDLAEVLEDPAKFELDEVNEALHAPYFVLREAGLNVDFVDLVNRLAHRSVGADLIARALRLAGPPAWPDEAEIAASLRAFTWFLDRAAEAPFPLTAAGYLKPVDVEAAAAVVPTMAGWIGKNNREIETTPVLVFRELLQQLGLLRKHKGTLRLTRAGAAARRSSRALLDALAAKLVSAIAGAEGQATLLTLAYAATSVGTEVPLEPVATALGELGWQLSNGRPIEAHNLYHQTALTILENVSDEPTGWPDRRRISPTAAALAHAALRRA